MRVLATGGAGYIGSITVRELLSAGHEVTVLDTLERGHKAAIDPRAHFVKGSVGDEALLDRVLPECDAVLHMAGYIEVAESQANPERYLENNVNAPLVMLDAMRRHRVTNIVFSSTAAVYGEPASVPITEDAPTEPVNAYGMSKLMFEQLLELYERAHAVRAVRLRYFNVAGALEDGSLGEAHDPETHIIPRVLRSIYVGARHFEVYGSDYPTPDGTCVRDYIHVSDLAVTHRLALERLAAGGGSGVFNLGNGNGYSNLEVVRTCGEVTGERVEVNIGPRREGDPAVLVASAALARDELLWVPQRGGLVEIVADAWRWHCRHPHGYADKGVTRRDSER
jgi:UDP-glucose 4-epimerase